MFSPDEIYSISNFLNLCKKTLANNVPSCWIQGEISNISYPSSGHIYFSLKDNKSQIRCVFFRLSQKNSNFKLENGLSVLVHANTTIYETRGDLQIIINKIEQMGLGNLALAFEQLKTKLAKKGLFDTSNKKPLPQYPQTIGVISSASGSVIQDIINILKRRYPFAKLLLFDTITQGNTCAKSVINALYYADKKCCDVLIIARGGGTLEDLWCFNEEALAIAIFKAKTPIISAIGHETDTTISDFVADFRAPSPSAAAELASPDRYQKIQEFNNYQKKITAILKNYLANKQTQLAYLGNRIIKPQELVNQKSQHLDNIISSINKTMLVKINLYKAYLNTKQQQLYKLSPSSNIANSKQQQIYLTTDLNSKINSMLRNNNHKLAQLKSKIQDINTHYLLNKKQKLANIIKTLELLSPLQTIARGYSISSDINNKTINTIDSITINNKINIRLLNGSLLTTVNKISSHKK